MTKRDDAAKNRFVKRQERIYVNGAWKRETVEVLQEKVGGEWKDVPTVEAEAVRKELAK